MLFQPPTPSGPTQTRLFESVQLAPAASPAPTHTLPALREYLERYQNELEQVPTFVRLTAKGTPITSSRKIALCFKKEHKHVLRDIRELQATLLELDQDEPPCFADHSYRDAQGQLRPEIVMTERGFMLLAMGFTGKEAIRFKLAFLNAFEQAQAQAPTVPVAAPESVEHANAFDITRVAQLAYYTREEMQVECVKQVAEHVMLNAAGGRGTLVHHHREVMKMLTEKRPSEYRQDMVDQNHRVKSFSGRQLLRRFEPAKAAAAAVLDDAVRLGARIQDLKESDVAKTLPAAFATLLALGLRPADLPAKD